jgi:hypothetical protein
MIQTSRSLNLTALCPNAEFLFYAFNKILTSNRDTLSPFTFSKVLSY